VGRIADHKQKAVIFAYVLSDGLDAGSQLGYAAGILPVSGNGEIFIVRRHVAMYIAEMNDSQFTFSCAIRIGIRTGNNRSMQTCREHKHAQRAGK